MSGEGEDGSLIIENLPKGIKTVTLEWVLIAQGVAEFYTIYETVAIQ